MTKKYTASICDSQPMAYENTKIVMLHVDSFIIVLLC